MAFSLQTIPLRELAIRITKGTTPSTLGHPFVEGGINFIKSESITQGSFLDASKFAFVDAKTHDALARSILAEGDVLFSMAGVYLGKPRLSRAQSCLRTQIKLLEQSG
ncbi:MAG: restriction endonuclease subunit S domain-containing protein [Acidobacteriaceae bacterium]